MHFDEQTGAPSLFVLLLNVTPQEAAKMMILLTVMGFLGRLIEPLGLVLIVGSNNHLKPDVPQPEIPTAFLFLGCWFPMAGLVYYFFGMETKGKSIAKIDRELAPA